MRLSTILKILNFYFFKALGSTYSRLHQRLPESFKPVCVCVWGAYSYMKVVYMCRPEFENGVLRKRSLAENRGLSERPLTEKPRGF